MSPEQRNLISTAVTALMAAAERETASAGTTESEALGAMIAAGTVEVHVGIKIGASRSEVAAIAAHIGGAQFDLFRTDLATIWPADALASAEPRH